MSDQLTQMLTRQIVKERIERARDPRVRTRWPR